MSRPVVREALRALVAQGFVEIRHGSGSFVLDVATQLAKVDPSSWFRENGPRVRDYYGARLVLEPEIAALASRNAEPEQLADLRAIFEHAEDEIARGRIVASIGLDIDFHRTIAAMAGNEFLAAMLATIIDTDTDLRRALHRLPGWPNAAHRRHRPILAAITHGDAAAARRAMIDALEGALRDVEELVKGGEGPVSREGPRRVAARRAELDRESVSSR